MQEPPTVPVAGAPVSAADLVDAARTVLRFVQHQSYVAWRENRWYADEVLAAEVRRDREDWSWREYRWLLRDTVFTMAVALDVLIAGIDDTPVRVVSTLDQLGVHYAESPDEDVLAGFDLLGRPALFDPIRESGFPVASVTEAVRSLGETRLLLMFDAGLSPAEILDAVRTGTPPPWEMLRMLAGLRHRPTSG